MERELLRTVPVALSILLICKYGRYMLNSPCDFPVRDYLAHRRVHILFA